MVGNGEDTPLVDSHVEVTEVDIDGKYILLVEQPLTDAEHARVLDAIEDWMKNPSKHFLVISGNAKLVKKGES